MKPIVSNKNIIGDYLKPIHTIPSSNPMCKPKNQLNATCKQKPKTICSKMYVS